MRFWACWNRSTCFTFAPVASNTDNTWIWMRATLLCIVNFWWRWRMRWKVLKIEVTLAYAHALHNIIIRIHSRTCWMVTWLFSHMYTNCERTIKKIKKKMDENGTIYIVERIVTFIAAATAMLCALNSLFSHCQHTVDFVTAIHSSLIQFDTVFQWSHIHTVITLTITINQWSRSECAHMRNTNMKRKNPFAKRIKVKSENLS